MSAALRSEERLLLNSRANGWELTMPALHSANDTDSSFVKHCRDVGCTLPFLTVLFFELVKWCPPMTKFGSKL
jgi:hypothetical protein